MQRVSETLKVSREHSNPVMCCVDVALTDAVVPQVPGQTLPLVLRVVVPLPLLELLTGQVLVLLLPLRIEDDTESTASRRPRSF